MPLLAILANPRRARAARKNRCCPNPSRCRHNRAKHHRNTILPMMAGGLMAGVSGAIATRLLRNPQGTLNDREREMWVSNDEGLYNWWKSSRLPMRAFLKENRAELDAAILKALNRPPQQKTWRDYHSNRGGRWYVGLGKGHDRSVFFSRHKPTEKSHGSRFLAVVGPYKSKAEASSKSALMNPSASTSYPRRLVKGPVVWEKLSSSERLQIERQNLNTSQFPYDLSGTYWALYKYPAQVGGMYLWFRTGAKLSNPLNQGEMDELYDNERYSIGRAQKYEVEGKPYDQGYYSGSAHQSRRIREKYRGPKTTFKPNPASVRAYRVPSGYEAKVASALRNLFVWAQAQDGRVLTIGKPSIVAKVIRHVCKGKAGTVVNRPMSRRNPSHVRKIHVSRATTDGVVHYSVILDGSAVTAHLSSRSVAVEIAKKTLKQLRGYPAEIFEWDGDTGVERPFSENPRLRHKKVLRNHGTEQNTIDVPFGQGKKYSIAQVQKWVETRGTPAMKKRFAMAMTQYKRFHKGSLPKFITYSTYKMGSHPGISDVEFGVSEGHEWMAAYQVPKSSGKWVDQASGGRYVHAHGDSDIDVDVKKPVNLSKLPLRFHTPDGKAVGVIPSKNVKIGEWYEG